jgi:hypothetical protein
LFVVVVVVVVIVVVVGGGGGGGVVVGWRTCYQFSHKFKSNKIQESSKIL